MAKILNQMGDFFGDKTIQKAYRFVVTFILPDNAITRSISSKNSSLLPFTVQGERFAIKPYHVKNAVLPQNSFKREIQKWGIITRSFPVYETEGMELRIELEEDKKNNVALFINYLQKLIIDEYGIYRHPSDNKFDVLVEVVDDQDNKVISYKYKESYFLNATEPTYAYSTNEAISYTLTFGTDLYEIQTH